MSRPLLVWLLLSSIWGSTWLVIKLGVDVLPPFTFAYVRFIFALAALLLVLWARRGRLLFRTKKERIFTLITGTGFFGMNYALVYWGEARIDSGMAAVLYDVLPAISLVMGHYMLPDDKITPAKLGGVGLSLIGVVMLFLDQLEVNGLQAVLGSAAIVAATAGTAFASIIVKKEGHQWDPVSVTCSQLIVGFVPLLLLGLVLEGNPLQYPWNTGLMVGAAYLGVMGTALTFGLLNWLFRHMAYSRIQLIPLASTIIAVQLGWLVRGETLSGREWVGTLLVLSGLITAAGKPKKP